MTGEKGRAPEHRVVGLMWWCGDDVCDCTQPVIEEITPNTNNPRFINRKRLWEGTFVSAGGEAGEREAQEKELDDAIKRFGAERE